MENKTILCFDNETGHLIKTGCDAVDEGKWSALEDVNIRPFAGNSQTFTFSAVAIEDTVYVLTWEREVYSIKPLSENPKWRRYPGSHTQYGHGPEPAVATYGGKIYVCGGGWQYAKRHRVRGWEMQRLSKVCEVFDTNHDKPEWTTIGNLRHMKRRNSLIAVKGKLYCIGGLGKSDMTTEVKIEPGAIKSEPEQGSKEINEEFSECEVEAIKSVERYDPKRNTWVEKAPLQIARVAPGVTKYQKWIFALGGGSAGERADRHSLDSIECFNTKTKVWEVMGCEMEVPRMKFVAHCTENEIIIVGGESDVKDYSPRSIEKIKLARNANAIELRRSSLTRCFYERDINCMATVFMQCPDDTEKMECDALE